MIISSPQATSLFINADPELSQAKTTIETALFHLIAQIQNQYFLKFVNEGPKACSLVEKTITIFSIREPKKQMVQIIHQLALSKEPFSPFRAQKWELEALSTLQDQNILDPDDFPSVEFWFTEICYKKRQELKRQDSSRSSIPGSFDAGPSGSNVSEGSLVQLLQEYDRGDDRQRQLALLKAKLFYNTDLLDNSYLPISAFFKDEISEDEKNLYLHFYQPLHDIRETKLLQTKINLKILKALIPSQKTKEPLNEWARRIYTHKLSLISQPKDKRALEEQKEQATNVVNEMLAHLPYPPLVVKIGKLTYENSLELAKIKNCICEKIEEPFALKQYLQDLILNSFSENPQKKQMVRHIEIFLEKFNIRLDHLDLIVFYEKIKKTKMDSQEKDFLLSLVCKCAKHDPRQEILEAFLKKYGNKQSLTFIHSLTKLPYMLDSLGPGPGALSPLATYFRNEFALFLEKAALFIFVYFPQVYLNLKTRIKILSVFPPKTNRFTEELIDIESLEKMDQGICARPPVSESGSNQLKKTASFPLKRQNSSPRCLNREGCFSFIDDVEEEEGILFQEMESSILWERLRQTLSFSFIHSTTQENPFEYQVVQFMIGILIAQGHCHEEAHLTAKKLISSLPETLFSRTEYFCTVETV